MAQQIELGFDVFDLAEQIEPDFDVFDLAEQIELGLRRQSYECMGLCVTWLNRSSRASKAELRMQGFVFDMAQQIE